MRGIDLVLNGHIGNNPAAACVLEIGRDPGDALSGFLNIHA